MRWRAGALALAITSCAGARQWTEDESGRIDAIIATVARPDAGSTEVVEEPELAMGPAPPLAERTGQAEQLGLGTPWSDRPWRRGKRFYLGYRRRLATK